MTLWALQGRRTCLIHLVFPLTQCLFPARYWHVYWKNEKQNSNSLSSHVRRLMCMSFESLKVWQKTIIQTSWINWIFYILTYLCLISYPLFKIIFNKYNLLSEEFTLRRTFRNLKDSWERDMLEILKTALLNCTCLKYTMW